MKNYIYKKKEFHLYIISDSYNICYKYIIIKYIDLIIYYYLLQVRFIILYINYLAIICHKT